MRYIIHEDMHLPSFAGRKVWMLGYTEEETGSLVAFEGYLVATMTDDLMDIALVPHMKDASGEFVPVFPHYESKYANTDFDGTYLFIADTEEKLFEIPKVIEIQEMFTHHVAEAMAIRSIEGEDRPDAVFFKGRYFYQECDEE